MGVENAITVEMQQVGEDALKLHTGEAAVALCTAPLMDNCFFWKFFLHQSVSSFPSSSNGAKYL